MSILPKELMSYKGNCKKNGIIIAKLHVIHKFFITKLKIITIADIYSMSRNTITKIIKDYRERCPAELHNLFLSNKHFYQNELLTNFSFLNNQSRKPHSNKRTASEEESNIVLKYFLEKGANF
jgi:hypothetical protein